MRLPGFRQRHTLVALVAVAAMVAACGHAQLQPSRLTAMSFNIRYDNPGDGLDGWPHRREWVAETIRSRAPDLLGIQEALLHQAGFLAASLPEYDWYGVGRDDGVQQGEFTPVFFRKDRFSKLDEGTFWLSETPEIAGSIGWDAAITRTCSWVRLREIASGREILVFNTHFDHRGEYARLQSASLLRARIAVIAGRLPWVLFGDFNAAPGSPAYRQMTAADGGLPVVDAYLHSARPPVGPDSTWNDFSAPEPGRRIDYIFTSDSIDPLDFVVLAEGRNGRFSSDHLPVISTLNW